MTPAASSPAQGRLLVRLTSVLLTATLIGACAGDDRLATLHREPLLGAPPDGVELAESETPGNRWPVETATRLQVIWGVEDRDAIADWYLEIFGDIYGLQPNHDNEWLGGRIAGATGVAVSVRVWDSLAEVQWDTYRFEQDHVDPWEGPVVVVSVSTGG